MSAGGRWEETFAGLPGRFDHPVFLLTYELQVVVATVVESPLDTRLYTSLTQELARQRQAEVGVRLA